MTGPYGVAALAYLTAGWRGVLPLPPGSKWPPPNGYTGAAGEYPSGADVYAWVESQPEGNIALRLPDGVIGLDVDAYDGKTGGDVLWSLAEIYGPLPDTWRCTSRDDDVSGIRLYRVPPGLRWPGELGPGLEVIQRRHRYAVVPPSFHPHGGTYRWLGPGVGPPSVADLTPLPSAWVIGITAMVHETDVSKGHQTSAEVSEWLDRLDGRPACDQIARTVTRALEGFGSAGSRHDLITRTVMRLCHLAVEGHHGARGALDRLGARFVAALESEADRSGAAEWDRILAGAVVVVLNGPGGGRLTDADPCRDIGAGIMPPGATLPVESLVSPPGGDSLDAETLRALELAREVYRQTLQREARGVVLANESLAAWRTPPSWRLDDLLTAPDEPIVWTVDQLMPEGSNVVINAQFKAGKTTLLVNLIRSLADGKPFLGTFPMTAGEGAIAFWNYEVSTPMITRWLRRMNIEQLDRVAGLNLRGYGTPLLAAPIVDWAVEWLKSHEVRHWLADPWGRMIVGTDENSNSDVGRWLDILDTIKERAGVENLIIPAHTGRAVQEIGSERARGATRLDDWADVRWLLSVGTGEDEGRRFLRAHGRDVDLGEGALTFDPPTGALTFGEGGRQVRKGLPMTKLTTGSEANPILSIVRETDGLTTNMILDRLRRAGFKIEDTRFRQALTTMVNDHLLTFTTGPNNSRHYHLGPVRGASV